MAKITKKDKVKHTIKELKELVLLLQDHFKELEREIEENNERNECKRDDKTEK